MPTDQLFAKLAKLKILEVEGIMSAQGSSMESFSTQVEDSRVEKQQLKQEITTIKQDINLPIGGSIPIPVNLKMELGLVLGNGVQVLEIEILKKPLTQKSLLKNSPLQGLLQQGSSLEEWKEHFDYSSTEDTFPGFWHKYKLATRSKDKTVKKLVVKKQPLKHKDLMQKPKLLCLQEKSQAKSQEWIKEILKNEEDNSNLLQESKLYGHQGKSKVNSGEWFKSILNHQVENSNRVRTSDSNLGFEAMVVESKQFPDTENVYDMKVLTAECENVQKEEQVARNPRYLAYDFQDLIKECKNLESDIYEARIPPYQSSNEVNVNELAGYLDNMLQIPREMSAMAKTMYT